MVEMLEDYYSNHPSEVERFIANMDALEAEAEGWDGEMPSEYESAIGQRLERLRKYDLSAYQSGEELTEEQEDAILRSLGSDLPGSRGSRGSRGMTKKVSTPEAPVLGTDEFEESFEG